RHDRRRSCRRATSRRTRGRRRARHGHQPAADAAAGRAGGRGLHPPRAAWLSRGRSRGCRSRLRRDRRGRRQRGRGPRGEGARAHRRARARRRQASAARAARSRVVRVGTVALVGAGPGDPGLMTVRGLELLRRAQFVVYDRLVDPRLLDEAPRARRIYAGKASGHHALPQERINALLIMHARRGRRVVRLKGGDPFVFGRGGEEAEALAGARIPFEIVPGVSSAVAVPAYAGIPLTHRGVASSFTVITGHGSGSGGESSVDWARLARSSDTLVVLM